VDPAFLRVKSDIMVRKCRLRLGEQAPHRIELINYGPLEARVMTVGHCTGPLLQYANGSPRWEEERPVPPKKSARKQTRSRAIELPSDSALGRFASFEQVRLEIMRARGTDLYEDPVPLTLELKLAP
jgi:hypothetical protein